MFYLKIFISPACGGQCSLFVLQDKQLETSFNLLFHNVFACGFFFFNFL